MRLKGRRRFGRRTRAFSGTFKLFRDIGRARMYLLALRWGLIAKPVISRVELDNADA